MRRYKTTPRERFLSADELKRLGFVLDHAGDAQTVAAIRLLLFTGARPSEITGLRWQWTRGVRAVLPDSKTGPHTIWVGPEVVKLVTSLPKREGDDRVFPDDLTSSRLYTFWTGVRMEADLPSVRIHDLRHTYASQGVMNGVGLPTVGRLLGHRHRATTAIYAHLDDATLQSAAIRTGGVIAKAMGFRAERPPSPVEVKTGDSLGTSSIGSEKTPHGRSRRTTERAPKGRNQLSAEPFGVVLGPGNRRAVIGVEVGSIPLEFRLLTDIDHRLAETFCVACLPICSVVVVGEVRDDEG